jgi:hypothetical protein
MYTLLKQEKHALEMLERIIQKHLDVISIIIGYTWNYGSCGIRGNTNHDHIEPV